MQKNTAGQKLVVFAFDRTDNTAKTGDAANITANLRKDHAAAAATNDVNPTETEDGFYTFDLTQAETNADTLQGFPASTTADIQVIAVPGVIYTTPVSFADDVIQTADHTSAIATVDANVDAVLVDTGATIPAQITALNDFNPSTDTVANVTLVATTTTNTDMRGTDSAATAANLAIVDSNVDAILIDTNELQTNQGNWLTATGFSTFNPATDPVANVTTVATTTNLTNNNDKTDYTLTSANILQIASDVWDEVLTGGTHNINNSAGRRLRGVSGSVLTDGTAQSATANTIQLASGDVSLDNEFVRSKVIITGGTGAGQEAVITDSIASTDTLIVTPEWLVTPDATSDYNVIPAQVHATVRNGGYDDAAVYVDVAEGEAGILNGVNGTSTNPSLTLADARIIADNNKLKKFIFDRGIGAPTLDQDYVGWRFEVRSGVAFNMNNKDVSFSVFDRAVVTGICTNNTGVTVYETCGILDLDCGEANFLKCGLISSLTLSQSGKAYNVDEMWSNTSPGQTAKVVFNGDGISSILFEATMSGKYLIQGMTSVDELRIYGNCLIELDATNNGGTVIYSGDVKITDNSTVSPTFVTGLTQDINDNAITPAQVNAEVVDVLTVDNFAEVSYPGATASLKDMIHYTYSKASNKLTQTATTQTLRNATDTGDLSTRSVSDDGTTFTQAKDV